MKLLLLPLQENNVEIELLYTRIRASFCVSGMFEIKWYSGERCKISHNMLEALHVANSATSILLCYK